MSLWRQILFLLLLGQIGVTSLLAQGNFQVDTTLFPVPENLEKNVNFWIKVFSVYSSRQLILHDAQDLSIIYEVVDFEKPNPDSTFFSYQKMYALASESRANYNQILQKLAGLKPKDLERLPAQEKSIYRLFGDDTAPNRFRLAAENIRIQNGLRDEFLLGIIRSGKYWEEMLHIFRALNLPEELICIPHVESSFNDKAYSKVGAAGIWQFMNKTATQYLRINQTIDERYDPLFATDAAARLLKENYDTLQTWPLAITAYNHGRNGLLRAKNLLGTADFGVILEKYHSPSFRFASRNFYAEFIAAVYVRKNADLIFGKIELSTPLKFTYLELPDEIALFELAEKFALDLETIREYNISIRPHALKFESTLPKTFKFRIPIENTVDLIGIYSELSRIQINPFPNSNNIVNLPFDTEGKNEITRTSLKREINGSRGTDTKLIKLGTGLPGIATNSRNIPATEILKNNSIIVAPEETLGHYAEWLDIPTQRLRLLNRIRQGKDIQIGQKIKLDFSNVTSEEFTERRNFYHQMIEDEFFEHFKIASVSIHQLKSGETVWQICNEIYSIPLWLLLKYNPALNISQLKVSDEIIIPIIESRSAVRTEKANLNING
jgi:membrane-bound lytic murein transglycosylase D